MGADRPQHLAPVIILDRQAGSLGLRRAGFEETDRFAVLPDKEGIEHQPGGIMQAEHVVGAGEVGPVADPEGIVVDLVDPLVDHAFRAQFAGDQIVDQAALERVHHLGIVDEETVGLGDLGLPEGDGLGAIVIVVGFDDLLDGLGFGQGGRIGGHLEAENLFFTRLDGEGIFGGGLLELAVQTRHARFDSFGRHGADEMAALPQLAIGNGNLGLAGIEGNLVHELLSMPGRRPLAPERPFQSLALAEKPAKGRIDVDLGINLAEIHAQHAGLFLFAGIADGAADEGDLVAFRIQPDRCGKGLEIITQAIALKAELNHRKMIVEKSLDPLVDRA